MDSRVREHLTTWPWSAIFRSDQFAKRLLDLDIRLLVIVGADGDKSENGSDFILAYLGQPETPAITWEERSALFECLPEHEFDIKNMACRMRKGNINVYVGALFEGTESALDVPEPERLIIELDEELHISFYVYGDPTIHKAKNELPVHHVIAFKAERQTFVVRYTREVYREQRESTGRPMIL